MGDFTNSLSIIIVVYNTALEDSGSFQSVRQMRVDGVLLDLFVYDNSARSQQLKEYSGLQITYLHDPENSGVSRAYNTGVAHAQKRQKKWVLLLDQDTTLPDTILDDYEKAVRQNPAVKLFVPILYLNNGKIFSPCTYRFKRGFYVDQIKEGMYSLNKLSPVNSGMLINIRAFLKAGGYNDQVKLDFSDFQFIERFRKVYPKFYVMDVQCQQDFSDDEVSFSTQASRFKYYCEGARNIDKEGIRDWVQYSLVVFVRALRLALRYKKPIFMYTYFNTFLSPSETKS